MTDEPNDAQHAEDALQELDALTGRTRRATRSMSTGLPLVGWGLAWIAVARLSDEPYSVVTGVAALAAVVVVVVATVLCRVRAGSRPVAAA